MAGEMDEIDALLSRIPTIRCGQCGNADTSKLEVRTQVWMSYSVLEVNPVNRRVYVKSIAESGDDILHMFCLACDSEIDVPSSWQIDFRYNEGVTDEERALHDEEIARKNANLAKLQRVPYGTKLTP